MNASPIIFAEPCTDSMYAKEPVPFTTISLNVFVPPIVWSDTKSTNEPVSWSEPDTIPPLRFAVILPLVIVKSIFAESVDCETMFEGIDEISPYIIWDEPETNVWVPLD